MPENTKEYTVEYQEIFRELLRQIDLNLKQANFIIDQQKLINELQSKKEHYSFSMN